MIKNQKGELTTQQIVMMVVAIVSFSIILFLLFRLNLGGATDSELCHNSVILRGSAVTPTEAVPLKCHRKYLCITEDGSCEGLTKPEIVKVKTISEIYEKLSEEMVNCWWMFGEGRVNYVGKDFSHNSYCSICSQILFDDSLENIKDIEKEISKDDFYNFLQNNNFDEKNSYTEYLFGERDINRLKNEVTEQGVGTFGKIELGKQYFVVMGITSEISLWQWAGAGTGVGAVAGVIGGVLILSNPAGWVVGAVIVGSSIVGGVAGGVASDISESFNPEIAALTIEGRGIKNQFMAPTIIEANSDKFKALNCEEVLTLA